tara:strand:+ start:426 stop:608 length:183 start_codon:yes stop_codon:yes gene_type:complete
MEWWDNPFRELPEGWTRDNAGWFRANTQHTKEYIRRMENDTQQIDLAMECAGVDFSKYEY